MLIYQKKHYNGRNNNTRGRFRSFNRTFEHDMQPEYVIQLGSIMHTCLDDLVVKSQIEDVPYFNAAVFNEDKKQIGKIDEIFGNMKEYWVSVKLCEDILKNSFSSQEKVFVNPTKLISFQKFLPQPGKKSCDVKKNRRDGNKKMHFENWNRKPNRNSFRSRRGGPQNRRSGFRRRLF